MTSLKPPNTIGVDVFIEGRKSRRYVGRLSKELADKQVRFVFRYDSKYLRGQNTLALGPELPLTKQEYTSAKLFPSFADRLPSRENPAYGEYLDKFHLSINEKDPLVLLTTIGRAGPSSFIFEPVFKEVNQFSLRNFRHELQLSVREYSSAFDITVTSIQRIENGKGGTEVLKRIELYKKFPATAIFEVNRNASKLHEALKTKLLKKLGELKETTA